MKILVDTSGIERLDAIGMAELLAAFAAELKSPKNEIVARTMRHAAKLLREQADRLDDLRSTQQWDGT